MSQHSSLHDEVKKTFCNLDNDFPLLLAMYRSGSTPMLTFYWLIEHSLIKLSIWEAGLIRNLHSRAVTTARSYWLPSWLNCRTIFRRQFRLRSWSTAFRLLKKPSDYQWVSAYCGMVLTEMFSMQTVGRTIYYVLTQLLYNSHGKVVRIPKTCYM